MLAVALSKTSQYMMTADSQGIVKTWSTKALVAFWSSHGCDRRPPQSCIEPVATWRAHNGGVSSICAMAGEEELFITSGFDTLVCAWSINGAHIGTFGKVRVLFCLCTAGSLFVPCNAAQRRVERSGASVVLMLCRTVGTCMIKALGRA